MMKTTNLTVDQYIARFPRATQKLLKQMRVSIAEAAPHATQKISYGIPTFVLYGNLVHFGGFAHHIGFYPAPAAIRVFKKELSKYIMSKGAVQFPLDQPLPLALIKKIVKFRVKENNVRGAKTREE